MAQHGDIKSQKQVREYETLHYRTAQGRPFDVTFLSREYTQSERYCEICGKLVTAKGIMGALLCVECGTPWRKEFRED